MSELVENQTRFPSLQRSVVEFSGRIPARSKVEGFKKQYLFKRAFQELLSSQERDYGLSIAIWMKTNRRMRKLSCDILLSGRLMNGALHGHFIEAPSRKHEAEDSKFYSGTVRPVLMLEQWRRQVWDQPPGVTA
jgi:hypothetical protein